MSIAQIWDAVITIAEEEGVVVAGVEVVEVVVEAKEEVAHIRENKHHINLTEKESLRLYCFII